MLIKELPPDIQRRALLRQQEQGNPPNLEINLGNGRTCGNFDWDKTPEGDDYWWAVEEEGDYFQYNIPPLEEEYTIY